MDVYTFLQAFPLLFYKTEGGVGSSDESEEGEEGEEEEGEVRGEMAGLGEGVESLTDALHSMTLQSPFCHPDRPSKVKH